MIIRDYYQEVIATVCRNTGYNEYEILHTNKEECVNARAILFHLLLEKGFSENQISEVTGLTRQCINRNKNTFRSRTRRWIVKRTLQQISNELATS